MWVYRERDTNDFGEDAVTFALGAAGGFAIGMLLSGRGRTQGVRQIGGALRDRAGSLRERARDVASRLRPARLRRAVPEQDELTRLEDAVLDAFLADEVLSERGVDVGGISRGIIELSGTVWTEEEARHAVRLAQRVPGVDTVVNRLDVQDDGHRHDRWPLHDDDAARAEREWSGRNIGMGSRRVSRGRDPDRPDDSQHIKEVSLKDADEEEFEWAGYAANPVKGERPEDSRGQGPDYSEDELDNQEPTGPHTYGGEAREARIGGQEFNTQARVGEGPKPGVELRLEAADVPVKPHGSYEHGRGGEGMSGQGR
jgi:osmotically-inducible protein OsmY